MGNGDLHRTGGNLLRVEVQAFWDGGRTWRVRFIPEAPGEWQVDPHAAPRTGAWMASGARSRVSPTAATTPFTLMVPFRSRRTGGTSSTPTARRGCGWATPPERGAAPPVRATGSSTSRLDAVRASRYPVPSPKGHRLVEGIEKLRGNGPRLGIDFPDPHVSAVLERRHAGMGQRALECGIEPAFIG